MLCSNDTSVSILFHPLHVHKHISYLKFFELLDCSVSQNHPKTTAVFALFLSHTNEVYYKVSVRNPSPAKHDCHL